MEKYNTVFTNLWSQGKLKYYPYYNVYNMKSTQLLTIYILTLHKTYIEKNRDPIILKEI